MDAFNGPNGFVGREVICREIQFERYRKPLVTSYPRRAIVLNPLHAKEQLRKMEASCQNGNRSTGGSIDSEGTKTDSSDDDDDDDPLNIEDEMMLCRNEQLRQLLHLRWLHIRPNGCGLQNMGNTCFVNSVLQALAYTPALAQYFANVFKSPSSRVVGASYDYAYALAETVRKIHVASNGVYRPGLIVSNLKSLSPHFRVGWQGDAHEFLLQLLHACHRSILFRCVGSRKVARHIEQTTALQRIVGGYLRSVVAWSRQEEIDRLKMAGKVQEAADLRISGHGHNCSMLFSSTYDPFVTLSVDVVGQTLEHCIAKLCEEEKLDGRSYITPRGVGVRASKRFQLHKLPPVIIIHLKRFNCKGGKVSKVIQYPKMLNVAPFCTVKGISKAMGRSSGGDGLANSIPSYVYELNAVCIHEGGSIDYGHYYSVVRAPNGTWLLCNDERVSYCDEKTALKQQAYMLFYSFVGPSPVGAGHVRKDTIDTLEGLSTNHCVTATSTFVHSTNKSEEVELGRQLRDDEVENILKKRKLAEGPIQHDVNSTEDLSNGKSNGFSGSAKNGLNNKHEPLENGNNSGHNMFSIPEIAVTKDMQSKPENGYSASLRKRGIIKTVMHTTQPVVGDTNKLACNGTKAVIGHHAVEAMNEIRGRNIPTTAVRPNHAPKFRQRVRDPLWESEMDRGRVKRVRQKKEEYTGENKFQKTKIEFDIRGRRCRRTD